MNLEKMSLEEIWEEIEQKLNEHPEYIKGIEATYKFDLSEKEGNKIFVLHINDGVVEIVKGENIDAECSLQMNVDNFKKLLLGNLNATTAVMTGRVKLKGNIGLALKLENILKKFSS
ncbi:MAG TPA: SCP2 sterol-binding domain-containing protein [Pseudogracilibacillus sp.]|nr:SCP2 sterol-binding domain-containing protein [Pseudogracilibacillus sp.]